MVARRRPVRAEIDLLQMLSIGMVLTEMAAVLDGASDNALQLKPFKGFEEIVKGASAEGAGRDVDVVDGGKHDHGEAGMVG